MPFFIFETMKIISFNVNGVRPITKKTFIEDMKSVNADVICLQETKATVEQTKEAVAGLEGYEVYGNQSVKPGYSGTAIITRVKPVSVTTNMSIEEHDQEGRVTCAEFDKFYLVTVYTPNSGSELLRLDYRQKWDRDFLAYVKQLEKTKPVLVCGDLNVAHKEIDLARPKANYNKSAGFMQEEIDGMDSYTANGLVDSFRAKNGEEVKYTWWSYRGGARAKNVGWRIDYFLVSQSFISSIKDAFILNDVHGSDHCPVGVVIE
jgi:exodeoxyribonuclease III